ncbi:protein PAT1 homolog 1-like isoform X2 [Ostrea edulis]|uniref:protein PAT1 homolog 1-like isoform X2 n=1 Tax=Ostrea edulis TaxID=37623 RepID=UPI002094E786|nr:protein PAT1 homolog 1-like isoform X2 [Ostrea edulis]
MEDTFSIVDSHNSALGAGMFESNELMEAPEEEDIDLMNDETFGGEIDEDFDWEEQHEKLIEVGDKVLYGRPSRDSDIKNYTSQEEYMEQSISQLVVEDEEMDDPAIVNVSKNRPIPQKHQNLDDLFGPSSPPALLDTEHLVSPTSRNIWGSPVKETHVPPSVNNLQTLFEFAKAASSSTHTKGGPVVSTPGRTLEELEQQLLPGSKGHAMTAEDLERQLRGEDKMSAPPPEPQLHHPPPGFPPGLSPGLSGLRNQTPQRFPPGYGPYIPMMDDRRSPMGQGPYPPRNGEGHPGATPPGPIPPHLLNGIGHVSPPSGRVSPLSFSLSPSSSPGSPQLSLLAAFAKRALQTIMGNRMPTAPIGIPRPLLRGPPPHSPYNSPGPRQSPHGGHYGPHHDSPYGPQHSSPYGPPNPGSYPPVQGSPGGPRPPHSMGYSDPRRGRGRVHFRGHNRGNYSNTDNREGYSEGHDPSKFDQGYHLDNREYRRDYRDNRREYDRRRYYHYNPDEDRKRSVDAYAGLMTQKEKDWIIKIQLIQLQTENPYLDDFYYTTYSLKKKAEERQKNHQNGIMDDKDPELNLIIPAMAKLETKPYKPAQFEGSLGRLTTSSVHNPRQIIDVRSDGKSQSEEPKNVSKELRRSRQLLMEIENGYNLLLDVDDIEKKILALPEEARKPLYEDRKNMLTDLYKYLLCPGNKEHFLSIMSIRKGRKLVARVLPLLEKIQAENLVQLLLKNMTHLIKKDQGDEGLMCLHDSVIRVIENCDLQNLVNFATELKESGQNQSKTAAVAIQNKFGSSLVCSLLHRGEVLHVNTSPLDMDNQLESLWCQFVHEFAGILAVVPTESLVHPKHHHATITEHLDRLLNKKLIAVIEDKVKLFTEPERAV